MIVLASLLLVWFLGLVECSNETKLDRLRKKSPFDQPSQVGNLTDSDLQCHESWGSWQVTSISMAHPTWYRVRPTTVSYLLSKGVGDGEVYTECDGVPRFRFYSSPTSSTVSIATITYQEFYGTDRYDTDSDRAKSELPPKPTCTIESSKCDQFHDRYRSKRLKSGMEDFVYPDMGRRDYDEGGPCNITLDGCMVNSGSEVVLIFWPPRVFSRDICANDGMGTAQTVAGLHDGPSVVTVDAITFQGLDVREILDNKDITSTEPKFILKGPFTFTSPTAYLAHQSIRAERVHPHLSRPAAFVNASLPAGVIALEHDDVRSLRPHFLDFKGPGHEYVRSIANGSFGDRPLLTEEGAYDGWYAMPFDFANVQNPVPARIYYDARAVDCWATQSHCLTITDDTYRPLLALKNKVWASILPDAFGCMRPEIVDPPIALRPAYQPSLALASLPAITSATYEVEYTSVPARPANNIEPSLPLPTESPQHESKSSGTARENSWRRIGPAQDTYQSTPGAVSQHIDIDSVPMALQNIRPVFTSEYLDHVEIGTRTISLGASETVEGIFISLGSLGLVREGVTYIPKPLSKETIGDFGNQQNLVPEVKATRSAIQWSEKPSKTVAIDNPRNSQDQAQRIQLQTSATSLATHNLGLSTIHELLALGVIVMVAFLNGQ